MNTELTAHLQRNALAFLGRGIHEANGEFRPGNSTARALFPIRQALQIAQAHNLLPSLAQAKFWEEELLQARQDARGALGLGHGLLATIDAALMGVTALRIVLQD